MLVDGGKIYLNMARQCMTMNQLAEKSQLSVQALNNIFKGKRNPKPATVGYIAKALGVDPADILKA